MRILVAALCLFAAVPGRAGGVRTGREIVSPISPAAAFLVQGALKASGRAPSGLLTALRGLDLSGDPGFHGALSPFLNVLASRVEAFPEDVPGAWFPLPRGFFELPTSERADLVAAALAELPAGRRDAVIEGILRETSLQAEQTALRYVETAEKFLYGRNAARRGFLAPMRLYLRNLGRMERTLSPYLSEPTRRRLKEARSVMRKTYLRVSQAELSERLDAQAARLAARDARLEPMRGAADDETSGGTTGTLTPELLEELRREQTVSWTASAPTRLALIRSLARLSLGGDPADRRLALKNIEDAAWGADPKVKAAAAEELNKARELAPGDARAPSWRRPLRLLAPVEAFLRRHSRWAVYAFGLGAVLLSGSASPGLFWRVVFIAAAALAVAALWKAIRRSA